ncbi:MAG: hypothetical protein EOM67_01030 [Spirochaetia bacterium]|nr:hypothetical protein [Spirochaetia bacterium]
MNNTDNIIKQLAHHIECVTHIDHYSHSLLQKMKEGAILSFTRPNSTTSISLCVEKKSNTIILVPVLSENMESREGEIIFTFPSYYNEKKMTNVEYFFQKEVTYSINDDGGARMVLIWIQRSFLYRYTQRSNSRLSLLKEKKSPSIINKIRYWGWFLLLKMKRRPS